MKLWATRDIGVDDVELWSEKPGNAQDRSAPIWLGKSFVVFGPKSFKELFGRLPRRDRPMRVTLTGRVPK